MFQRREWRPSPGAGKHTSTPLTPLRSIGGAWHLACSGDVQRPLDQDYGRSIESIPRSVFPLTSRCIFDLSQPSFLSTPHRKHTEPTLLIHYTSSHLMGSARPILSINPPSTNKARPRAKESPVHHSSSLSQTCPSELHHLADLKKGKLSPNIETQKSNFRPAEASLCAHNRSSALAPTPHAYLTFCACKISWSSSNAYPPLD